MSASPKRFLCRTITVFGQDGKIHEDGFSRHLDRLAGNGIGVLLSSSGSGEGASLTTDEIDRVYRIGVDVCRGRVPVYSNQQEEFTAVRTIERARQAIAAGVEALNIYGPNGLHGYVPTEEEYLHYFDKVLSQISHPVTLCPNRIIGYTPLPLTIASIVNRYPQVIGVLLSDWRDGGAFLRALQSELKRDVEIYVNPPGAFEELRLGANLEAPFPNLIPDTCRRLVDAWNRGDEAQARAADAEIRRLGDYVGRWRGSAIRWIKAAMLFLDMDGGRGGLREPYLMMQPDELQAFGEGLLQLRLPEIDALARRLD